MPTREVDTDSMFNIIVAETVGCAADNYTWLHHF